jgi:hypothetical protein
MTEAIGVCLSMIGLRNHNLMFGRELDRRKHVALCYHDDNFRALMVSGPPIIKRTLRTIRFWLINGLEAVSSNIRCLYYEEKASDRVAVDLFID